MIRQVVLARTAFSTNPSKGPRSSIRLARSSWNTSQIGPILELRMPGSLGVGDALIFQPRIQLGEALHPRLRAGTSGRADCRPGSRPDPSPIPRRACRPPVRSDGASTSAESGDYTGAPCRRRSPRPPSSCCRRCRAGRPRHRTGTPCRGRRTPAPGSRGSRRARTACGCATASCAPP